MKWCKKGGEDTSHNNKDATDTTTSATASATSAITRSNDTYIYGVVIIAALAISVCVVFAYNKKHFQGANKGEVKGEPEQPFKPLKRHNMPPSQQYYDEETLYINE